jgi:hypothetical protein
MIDRCPPDYKKRGSKDFIHINDIVWNTETKKYEFSKQYGSGTKVGRQKVFYSDDNQMEELIRNIRLYPHISGYGRQSARSKANKFAHILWLSGVENIVIGHSNYEQKPENVLMNHNSFTCYPYITFPFTNNYPFLHWLLKYHNISFSGGAGEVPDYMQASWSDKEGFIKDLVLYFHCLKDQFGNAADFYKEKAGQTPEI